MGENTVVLDSVIVVGCYLFTMIALIIAVLWIYRLKEVIVEVNYTMLGRMR